MIAPNTMLQNRYLVKRHIGRGGMGTVYEAFDTRLHATVALKETLLTDQASLKAFEREAALLARMRHPVLPKVIDYFTEHAGQFLVMEYIQGDDLAKLMEQRGGAFPLDSVLPWAMHWADQLLDALTYLHEQSPPIYHRDIKPQNLKLTAQGDIILLDFGLAKGGLSDVTALSPSRDNRSITGYTPNYAPLEQIRGAPPDPRTDLYSLGATLYHLSTGVKPPDALSRAAALLNNQKDPLLPAHHHNPNIPPAVSAVLHGAMALSPEGRAPSAAIMRKALLRARSQGAADDANTRTDVMDKTEMTGSGSTIQQSSDSLTLQSVHASVQAGVVNITTSAAPSIVSQSEQPSATEVVSPETPALHLDPVSEVNLYRTLLTGHQMLCLAFSPDSQRIVGGGLYGPEGQMRTPGQNAPPGVMRLWRLNDGRQENRFRGHTSSVHGVAFSPDGELIMSGSEDSTVRLWWANNQNPDYIVHEDVNPIESVAFSPDGRLMAIAGWGRCITLFEMGDGQLNEVASLDTGFVHSLAFSPDGRLLAAGCYDTTIRLWDLQEYHLQNTLEGHTNFVLTVAFSPDGCRLASGGGGPNIHLWDIEDGEGFMIATLEGHTNFVRGIAFSPNGETLASASEDQTVRLWRVSDGSTTHALTEHSSGVTDVAFSPDGQYLASSSRDTKIRIWEVVY